MNKNFVVIGLICIFVIYLICLIVIKIRKNSIIVNLENNTDEKENKYQTSLDSIKGVSYEVQKELRNYVIVMLDCMTKIKEIEELQSKCAEVSPMFLYLPKVNTNLNKIEEYPSAENLDYWWDYYYKILRLFYQDFFYLYQHFSSVLSPDIKGEIIDDMNEIFKFISERRQGLDS